MMTDGLKLVEIIQFAPKGYRLSRGITCFFLGHKWKSTHWIQDDSVGFSCDRCGKVKE